MPKKQPFPPSTFQRKSSSEGIAASTPSTAATIQTNSHNQQSSAKLKDSRSSSVSKQGTASSKPMVKTFKNVDSAMANRILDEIVSDCQNVTWDDIAGLSLAKQTLKETVILPISLNLIRTVNVSVLTTNVLSTPIYFLVLEVEYKYVWEIFFLLLRPILAVDL